MAHLVVHLRHAALGPGVLPAAAEALRDLLDDPEILARIARHVERAASELHHAVGVGDGAGLLGPRGRRQHDIGEIRRLGEEDVLHHEVVHPRESFACVVRVGIRHRRILAHDVHAADLPGVNRVHDFDYGEPGLGIERFLPERLELTPDVGAVDALVIGIHHRDQADVARALHVVLPAQGMESRSGPSHLPRDQRERDQATRVVGAVHVL